ncbi:MAG: excinuclease ABC subunit C, partial [Myxococcales bacterium]|nr:excinuclease ABC subunit C [Myxococcales bacterium]
EPLAEWLAERKGMAAHGPGKIAIKVPKRGPRKKLVILAERNAASNFATRRNKRDDAEAALERMRSRLRLSRLPRRIECFDISHIQGSDPVASMVVFVDGQPDKSAYRHFKVEGLDRSEGLSQAQRQNDDFRSMYEVLGRRLRRAIDDEDWALPDLIVIDGGKGQLGRVVAAMQDLGIALGDEGVDLVSLAKERKFAITAGKRGLEQLRAAESGESDEDGNASEKADAYAGKRLADHVVATADNPQEGEGDDGEVRPERVFVPGAKDAIVLAHGSSELYLMTRLRDEAHRFAIEFHRKRRGKRSLASALDGIDGVGPAIKKALIRHFGTIKAIREATPEQLQAVKGVGPKLAQTLWQSLHG